MPAYDPNTIRIKTVLFEMEFAQEIGAYQSMANLLIAFMPAILRSGDKAAVDKLKTLSHHLSATYLECVAHDRELPEDGLVNVRNKIRHLIRGAALDREFEVAQKRHCQD